jgi:hypothetical protein
VTYVATVALVACVVALVVTYATLRVFERTVRQHARERDLLTNKLLHAVGRPWQEAPAQTAENELARLEAELRELDGERAVWISPEQRPVS